MKEAFTHKSLLILGRGIGQVMFQNNALSGLLMLIGIFLNSWQMGLLAVSGNIISTSTGRISGYDRDDIKNGLYGFNGTLVGIAVGVFMHLTVNSLILMAIASCASTYIARFFNMQRMTGLFFLAGILVNSRNAAVYTILGVLLPLPLAILLGADSEALNIGLMGYNGVLCAIALGGKSWMSLYGLYVPFYSLLYCKLWE